MEPARIENRGPYQLVGLDESYTFSTMREIPQQWDRFSPSFGHMPGQIGYEAFGIAYGMTGQGFRYFSGVPVVDGSPVPEGFVTRGLPEGKYAIFPFAGHLSEMSGFIMEIWQGWYPRSGMQTIDDSFTLEWYGESFDPRVGKGDIEIWIPVKS